MTAIGFGSDLATAGTNTTITARFQDGSEGVVAYSGVRRYPVRQFGAQGNQTDDTQYLQAAMNSIVAVEGTNPDVASGKVFFDAGSYFAQAPITGPAALAIAVEGDSHLTAQVRAGSNFFGPLFWIYDGTPATDLFTSAPSLLTGAGTACVFARTENPFLNLSHVGCAEVHGRTSLTKHFAIKPTTVSNGTTDMLTGAFGASPLGGANSSGLCIWVTLQSTGLYSILAQLTTTASVYTLNPTGSTFSVGAITYISAEYDGTDFALYAGAPGGTATRLAHTAASGTVVRLPWHEETLGRFSPKYPAANGEFNGLDGAIDSFEILKLRLHSGASFTAPTAKHAAGADTLVLLNFDSFDRAFVVGKTSISTPVYLPLLAAGEDGDNHRSNVTFKNIFLDNPRGIALGYQSTLNLGLDTVHLAGYHPLYGYANSYNLKYSQLLVECGTDNVAYGPNCGMSFANGAIGISELGTVYIVGGKIGFGMSGGYGGKWGNVFWQPSSDAMACGFLYGEPNSVISFSQFGVDGEGTWNDFKLGFHISAGASVSFEDSNLELKGTHSADSPLFYLDSISQLVCKRSLITSVASVTKLVQFAGAASPTLAPENVTFEDCRQVGTPVSWAGSSDVARIHVVDHGLDGSITISGASTSGTVTLPVTMPDARYSVTDLVVIETAGTPNTKSAKVSIGQTTGGFTITLDAAPGTNNTVKVRYRVGY